MTAHASSFGLLLVDDEKSLLLSLKRALADEPYRLHTASSGEEALAILTSNTINAAVVDLKMPGMSGIDLNKKIKKEYPHVSVVILTAHGGVREAVAALQSGAVDFLEKPFSPTGIRARLRQLYKIWQLKNENRELNDQLKFQFGFRPLVGNSPAMMDLKRLIAQVGGGDAPVLVQGQTGTGKELVAQAIHAHSNRAQDPFVPVDCTTISDSVIESELFGHVKGAFTGALSSTLGLIRSAHGGTLFFDEIGELPINMQTKLLRVLQENEVRPVGSSKRHKVDIRVISATNRDLQQEVADGNFRQDLYYRLNIVTLHVPPLKKRKDDIPLLARHFLRQFKDDTVPLRHIAQEALDLLEGYDWPGNVRELENVVRRAVALSTGASLQAQDLPPELLTASRPAAPTRFQGAPESDTMQAYEIAAIRNAMKKCDNNRKAAASMLNIGLATIFRKIKHYGLEF